MSLKISGSSIYEYVTNLLLAVWTGVASAVNYLGFSNAATGAGPQVQALGTDADVDLLLVPKGAGAIRTTLLKGNGAALSRGMATVAMAADANQALTAPQYACGYLVIAGGTTLTATRDITVPLTAGASWDVFNNAPGAQSLQFIGASGTGITVATGKRARLIADGTNICRVSLDA